MARAKLIAVALALAGIACIAQAQVNMPLTGVGSTVSAGGGLLLDNLSATAIGAFSTRKLRSAYAGNALKVTTSAGGNATQDIGFSSNNLDTTSMSAFIGANSGSMNTWYDQTTGSHNATQGTIAAQPVLVASGANNTLNGNVCATWNASNLTQLSWVPPLTAQPLTLAFLLKITTNISGGHMHDSTSGTRVLFGQHPGTYTLYAQGLPIDGGTIDTNVHTSIAIFNGVSSSVLIDGSSVISGNPGAVGLDGTNSYQLGNQNYTGRMCEFLAFNSAISGSDQSAIRTSWQTYWGAP